MIEAFIRISLPHFLEHKLRTVLTALGLALGAATGVGLDMTFQPIHESLRLSAQRLAGSAVLRVANSDGGVPEELLDEIRQVPGVKAATASIQGSVGVAGLGGERLYLFGVDLLEDQHNRDYEFLDSENGSRSKAKFSDPLVFLARPDSVALSGECVNYLGRKIGDSIEVDTLSGRRTLTIRATLDTRSGPASLFGGHIALMDIFAAQRLLQFDRRFGQIDISIKPGSSLDVVTQAVGRVVAGRGTVERETRSLESMERMISLAESAVKGANSMVGFLGLYIVFNTMTIAVAQRRREIGILRCAGARRSWIIRLILAESLIFAVTGGLVGIPLGIEMARFFSVYFLPLLGGAYAPARPPALHVQLAPIITAFVGGLIAAPLAALLPALQAARVHPIDALRRAPARTGSSQMYWKLAVVGLLVLGVGQFPMFVPDALRSGLGDDITVELVEFGISYTSFCVGVCLVAPFLIQWAAIWSEPIFVRMSRRLGGLASRSIIENMGRIALTGTAFVMCVMMGTFLATAFSSARAGGAQIFDTMLGGFDLLVSGDPLLVASARSDLLPERLVDKVAKVPGVSSVGALRIATLQVANHPLTLFALDSIPGHPGFQLIDGDSRQVVSGLAGGEAAVIDGFCAHTLHLKQGDKISLVSPSGLLRLPVIGIAVSALLNTAGGVEQDQGQIFISRELYREKWRDKTVTLIGPVLTPQANPTEVMSAIRTQLGGDRTIYVLSADAFRRELQKTLSRSLAPMVPIFTFALFIAILGLVNSLFASVLDRTREVGLLRAAGATSSQIGRMILLEAAALGMIGAAIAIPIGISMGYLNAAQNHYYLDLVVFFAPPPPRFLLAIFTVTAAAAAAAGYLPGLSAGRMSVVAAISTE